MSGPETFDSMTRYLGFSMDYLLPDANNKPNALISRNLRFVLLSYRKVSSILQIIFSFGPLRSLRI